MVKRVAKLIMVTAENNNKFYDMTENDDGSIDVVYGRVDVTSTSKHYECGQRKWDALMNSKLKKGYEDVTALKAIDTAAPTASGFTCISNSTIKSFVDELQRFANKSIQNNYTVTSEAVTQIQVDRAQEIIDAIVPLIKSRTGSKAINEKLLDLYKVIPRRMKHVNDHLIPFTYIDNDSKVEFIEKLTSSEQATLDVMKGQVAVNTASKGTTTVKPRTILEAMGIAITKVTAADVTEIKKQLGGMASQYSKAFRVINKKTQASFDKFVSLAKSKKTRLFWHGSRNENWWSILDTGLMLRPSNVVTTGKMFGYGLYFADRAKKSVGYTSLRGSYWASGSSNKGFMALYDVHLGNPLKIKHHQSWCYELTERKLKSRGDYDSLFAEGGADLRNNEFIVYHQSQCTIKYIVEIK